MSPATTDDADLLAPMLRPVEVDEVWAAEARDPRASLRDALRMSSEAWTVHIGGSLAAIWGAAELNNSFLGGRVGIGWLLTSSAVERYPVTFWRLCLAEMPRILERWDALTNAIDIRHAQAIRWAIKLGFRLDEPRAFGAMGLPFRLFRVTKEDVCARPQYLL